MKKYLLPAVVAAALYFLLKKKPQTAADTTTTGGNSGASDLEQKYFTEMSQVIESDPVFQRKMFPADFYDAVLTDYQAQQSGTASTYNNDPIYKTGLPGAFEGVADAWQSAMGFNQDTHAKLWTLYNQYRSLLTQQKL